MGEPERGWEGKKEGLVEVVGVGVEVGARVREGEELTQIKELLLPGSVERQEPTGELRALSLAIGSC